MHPSDRHPGILRHIGTPPAGRVHVATQVYHQDLSSLPDFPLVSDSCQCLQPDKSNTDSTCWEEFSVAWPALRQDEATESRRKQQPRPQGARTHTGDKIYGNI